MIELISAILCSVTVGILLKFARHKNVDVSQSIAVNYVVASTLCYFLLKPDFQGKGIAEIVAESPDAYLFLILSITLPSIFIIQAKALEFAGIIRTDAAQRLSLFLPIIAAFTLFGESLTANKGIAIFLAFIALGCLLWKGSQAVGKQQKIAGISLLFVWLGYGVNDILFKQIAKSGAAFPLTLFISFVGAGCLIFIYLTFIKRVQWQITGVLTGLLLGLLNFGNILFYIQAHQAMKDDPTLVFTGMNLGVICLGTLAGAVLFKEKIHKINYLGVAVAICAIICLFYFR